MSKVLVEEEEPKGGQVLFTGNSNWSLVGRGDTSARFDGVNDQQLLGFQKVGALMNIQITKVISGPQASHNLAIATNGNLYVWGRNEEYQLGLKDMRNRYNPTLLQLEDGKRAAGGACGHSHTLVYTTIGEVYAMGADRAGQCGQGRRNNGGVKAPSQINSLGTVVDVSCGKEFSVAVTAAGKLYSWGSPENGQLGNGTDGKTLEKAGKFTYDYVSTPTEVVAMAVKYPGVKVARVSCGTCHTCAMDDEGRLYTWGFGGYGRLGHKDNKDQFEPLAIEKFSDDPPPPDPSLPSFMRRTIPKTRARLIVSGATCTYAVVGPPYNYTYMWGITKKSGEANMYPMPVEDVMRLRVRSLASGNTSTILASEDDTLVTWGASPTFGELGYGEASERKSSTKPDYVEELKGVEVLHVAMGYSHSLAIVDTSNASTNKVLEGLPTFEPEEVADADVPKKKKTGGANKKKKAKKATDSDDDDDDDEEDVGGGAEEEVVDDEDEEEAPPAKGKAKGKKATGKRKKK